MFPEAGNGTNRAGITSLKCHLTSHHRFCGERTKERKKERKKTKKSGCSQRNECQHVGGKVWSIEWQPAAGVTMMYLAREETFSRTIFRDIARREERGDRESRCTHMGDNWQREREREREREVKGSVRASKVVGGALTGSILVITSSDRYFKRRNPAHYG